MRNFLIFVALNTATVYLVHQILDTFVVTGGTLGFVIVGVIIGLVNGFVKPILKVLSLPFIFLTAGLFVIIVNAASLWIAEHLIAFLDFPGISLVINGFGTYIAAVLLLGILNYLFQKLLR